MKIKVGDKIKLRNGSEDIIVAKLTIESVPGQRNYRLIVGSLVDGSAIPINSQYPFISKKGNSYAETGQFYLGRVTPHPQDIVEIVKYEDSFDRVYAAMYRSMIGPPFLPWITWKDKNPITRKDINFVYERKNKVKKYRWVFKDSFSPDPLISSQFYSEEEIKLISRAECRLWHSFEKIDSTMKEVDL